MAKLGDRIVVLIDMDCFFCQVETRLQPELKGKPLAVIQYNRFTIGKIIAASYEARNRGIKKHMIANEAKEICPDLILVSAPVVHGKSDISRYRNGGREVIEVLKKHSNIVERSSIDEAYLDITDIVDGKISKMCPPSKEIIKSLPNTYIVGYSEVGENDEEQRSEGLASWITMAFEELEDNESQRLAIAGILVERMRADVLEKTGFKCSAGISYNKFLAKLACGLHKPNRQTILPSAAVSSLFSTVPVKKVRNLGGKFGDVVVESLGCKVLADLLPYSLQNLQARFDEKTGLWLYNIVRGIDNEPVTIKLEPKSISVSKEFNGSQAIVNLETLEHWVGELAAELCDRLNADQEEYKRRATLLIVSFRINKNGKVVSQSRSCPLTSYKPDRIAKQSINIITKSNKHSIGYLGISVGKFIQVKGSNSFVHFFKTPKQIDTNTIQCINQKQPHTFGTQDTNNTLEPKTSGVPNSRINEHPSSSCKSTCVTIHESEDDCGITTSQNKLTENAGRHEQLKNKNENSSFEISESANTSLNVKNYATLDEQSSPVNQSSVYEDSVQSIEKHYEFDSKEANSSGTDNRLSIADATLASQLTTMSSALHADNFKKSFFMNIFNKSNSTKAESDSSIEPSSNYEKSIDYNENEAEAEPLPLNSMNSDCRFDSQASSSDIFAEDYSNNEKSTEKRTGSSYADANIKLSDHSENVAMNEREEQNDSNSVDTAVILGITSNSSLDNSSAYKVVKHVKSSAGHEVMKWESNEIDVLDDRLIPEECHGNLDCANLCVGATTGKDIKLAISESRLNSETQSTMTSEKESYTSVIVVSDETNEEQSAIVQLQEIFPDMNNIDQSIVALLPPLLQREANSLLKKQKEKSVNNSAKAVKLPTKISKISKTTAERSKPKLSNVESGKNVNKINTFFSKSNGKNPSGSGSSQECLKCHKSIPLETYLEHLDFHVAQDLQRTMNRSPMDDLSTSKGTECASDSVVQSARTKRTKNETAGTRKKCKSIASFFS